MSLSIAIASALVTDASHRGPRGVLNELKGRIGAVGPLTMSARERILQTMTLQQRRLEFIQREMPVAYAILRQIWPMYQASNPITGNNPVRSRLLAAIARKLHTDPELPSSDTLIDFSAIENIDNYTDNHLDNAMTEIEYDLEEEIAGGALDVDDVESYIVLAYDLAMNDARNAAKGIDDDGWADSDGELEWYEHHSCRQPVLSERTAHGQHISTRLHIGSKESTRPTAIHRDTGGDEILDPAGLLPPWATSWIMNFGVTDEELHELANHVHMGATEPESVIEDWFTEEDTEWLEKNGLYPRDDLEEHELDDPDAIERWTLDKLIKWTEREDIFSEVVDMTVCLATQREELDKQERAAGDAVLTLIDWRTANPDADIESASLIGLFRGAFQEHFDDMVRQEAERFVEEICPGVQTEEKAERIAKQQVVRASFSDGAEIVEITGTDALHQEGTLMHHCIGQHRHRHPGMLKDGTVTVFSDRDPSGKPRATWEAFNTEEMNTSDLQGPHNGASHDDDARDRMTWFIVQMRIAPRDKSGETALTAPFSSHDLNKLWLLVSKDSPVGSGQRIVDALSRAETDLLDRSF